MGDDTLLKEFAANRSEAAFAAVVRQHVNLVFATAYRQLGNHSLAEEVSQNVFVMLARKAGALGRHPTITGWLHNATLLECRQVLRTELRRQRREQVAVALGTVSTAGDSVWASLVPLLDEALLHLNEKDRLAVLLRFLEEKPLREVGQALGASEDAAQKRVAKALSQMTDFFRQRGFAVPTLTVGAPLFAAATHVAPAALANRLVAASLVGTTTSSTLTILGFMTTTKLKVSAVGALMIAAITVPVWQGIQLHRVSEEKSQMETQLAELPALRQELQRLRLVEAERTELEPLRDLQTKTQGELAELRARLQRSEAQAALLTSQMESRLSRLPGNTNAKQRFIAGLAMMEGQAMRKALEQMPRLRAKLNLTPGQEEAIQELMRKRAQRVNLLMETGTNGTPRIRSNSLENGKELNEIMEGSVFGNVGEQIKSILSPEQQTPYQELVQEEATRNASDELARLQAMLGLTDEQRKKVFTILYYDAFQLLGPSPSDGRVEAWITQLTEQRIKALQDVLTPAQMATYRQHSPSPKVQ